MPTVHYEGSFCGNKEYEREVVEEALIETEKAVILKLKSVGKSA